MDRQRKFEVFGIAVYGVAVAALIYAGVGAIIVMADGELLSGVILIVVVALGSIGVGLRARWRWRQFRGNRR